MFATGSGSNPDFTKSIITELGYIIYSGIIYDLVKEAILYLEGVDNVNYNFVLLISWLSCCGEVV